MAPHTRSEIRNRLIRTLQLRREGDLRTARRGINPFVEMVLKDATGQPVVQAQIHQRWQAHIDRCRAAGKLCGILAPWGHGKTEQAIIARALHAIGENPDVRIKIVCNNEVNAEARLSAIARYITDDPDYRAVYPHVEPAPSRRWTRGELTVARASRSKDPTVEAHGILSGGIGGRCDLLLVDDPVDLRNGVTLPALRRQVAEAFRNVWLSRLEPGGELIYIATRWHMGDLTGELMESNAFAFLEMRVAENFDQMDLDDPFADPGTDTVPLWTAHWNEANLRKRCEQVGRRAFDRGFRQNPLCDRELLFPRDVVTHCFDYTLTPRDLLPDKWVSYVGVDLAGSKRAGNVIFVLGVAPDGRRVPLEILRGAWSAPETAKRILEVHRRWRPQRIVVENNAYQQSLLDWMALLDCRDMPVQPFTTGVGKHDPAIGLPSLAVEFANNAWRIPMGLAPHGPACLCNTCCWVEEMVTYPLGKSSDLLMASWFAREAARSAEMGSVDFYKLPELF